MIKASTIITLLGVMVIVGYMDALTRRIPTTDWTEPHLYPLILIVCVATVFTGAISGTSR